MQVITFTILNLTDPKLQVGFGIGLDLKQNCICLLKQKGRLVFAFLCWSKYWYSGSDKYVIVDNWTEDCTLFVKTVSLQSCTLHCTAHTHNQDVLISVKHSVPSNIQMTEQVTDCLLTIFSDGFTYIVIWNCCMLYMIIDNSLYSLTLFWWLEISGFWIQRFNVHAKPLDDFNPMKLQGE